MMNYESMTKAELIDEIQRLNGIINELGENNCVPYRQKNEFGSYYYRNTDNESVEAVVDKSDFQCINHYELNNILVELLQSSGTSYLFFDKNGSLLDFNNNFIKEIGYNSDELKSMNVKDLVSNESFNKITSIFDKKLKIEKYFELELELIGKYNIELFFNVDCLCDYTESGELFSVHCIGWNITPQKLLELQVKNNNHNIINLSNIAPVLLWKINSLGHVVFVNKYFRDFLGIFQDYKVLQNWSERIHPDDFQKIYTQFKECFIDRKEFEAEYRVMTKDNIYKWILDRRKPVYLINGVFDGYICCAFDIDDRKKFENDYEIQNKKYESLNASKDKLLKIIAQDLNAQLVSLMTISKNVASKIDVVDMNELQNGLEMIFETCSLVNRLLENLLHWAQIQMKTVDVNLIEYPIESFVNDIVFSFKKELEHKMIDVKVNVAGNPLCQFDSNIMKFVLMNVLSNALKYSNKHDNITIGIKPVKDKNFLFIKDFGIGIKPKMLDFIFDVHNKFQEPGTDGEAGTGLGLALCKEYMNLMGKNFYLESNRGVGTTVFIEIEYVEK